MSIKKPNKIYFIGGVNGVGKSSFLQALLLKHQGFEVLWGSRKFMEWLGLQPNDYDALRNLPDDYKDKELDKMMKKLLKEKVSNGRTLIIDGHYLNCKRGEVVDSTGNWISFFDALFVISASPKTILRRVEEDESKNNHKRKLLPADFTKEQKLELLDNFIRMTTDKAREISEKYQMPYFIIDNNKDGFGDIIEEFLKYDSVIS